MDQENFESAAVAYKFAAYPASLRRRLLDLRALVLDVAKNTNGVGRIEETLKWGQPSYLTPDTKSGTTIRIDSDDSFGGDFALYVNCQTTLVDDWRNRYPELVYGGNRSVHFRADQPLPDATRHLIAMALTYHLRKKASLSAAQ
mgnify:CR=1 FL=1